MKELLGLAKAAPNRMNYASGGEGGINHLAGEMLKTMCGTRLVHVPYKGAGPALTALMGGEVQVMIATLGSALMHVRTGKLKALAAGGDHRSSIMPDLPTVSESGVPGYAADNWYGVLAPRNVPPAVVRELNKHIAATLNADAVRVRFTSVGFEPSPSAPSQFAEYLRAEVRKWNRVAKEAGIESE
jgi:tripartite-type tricarboxylate transporter receptor subunit TctC